MSEEIGIVDLLRVCGFDPSCRSKLVRHQDQRWESHGLLRRGWLDVYQSFQSRPVFDNLDYIISFIGAGGTQARLVGVYKVLGRRPGSSGVLPPGCPYLEWKNSEYFYELERQTAFESLEHRVVIEMGPWSPGMAPAHDEQDSQPIATKGTSAPAIYRLS